MGKKIIFYIDSMQFGGAQRVMTNLLSFFSSMDYSVLLINDILPQKDIPEYPIDGRVQRLFLESKDKNFFLKNINKIIKLRKIIQKEKPDFVVSFLGPPNFRLILAAIGLKCKVIVSVRNDPYYEYGSGIKKFLSNFIFLGADGVVFQTDEARMYFHSRIRAKSKVILNPVDDKFYHLNWTPLRKEIIVVGRLEKQKNPFLAIDAFLNICTKYPDYNLVFYGEGTLREKIANYIEKHNAQNRIFLRGRTSDIAEILSNASLYIMTSDFEGLPNALMEAMTVGLPCISTDCPCGGPRILINNGVNGILVKCNDSCQLASALDQVLASSQLMEKLSYNAKRSSQSFRSEYIFGQWSDFINSIV